jgi:drug/metabolite transporter (DMT)-like permease
VNGVTFLAIAFALASAFVTALSTSVQHHAAGRLPESVTSPFQVLWHLAKRPLWLLGQLLGLLGFVFHFLALGFGPIALVQPIIITGIVFAVPIRAAISRTWPERRELVAVVMTAAALAIFLAASDPGQSAREPLGPPLWLLILACYAGGWAVFFSAKLRRGAVERAFLMGAGAGVFLGMVAVLIKAAQAEMSQQGFLAIVTTWPMYLLTLCGLTGVAVNQAAYRTARLSASMPVLNAVNIMVGLTFGYFVFHETPRTSPIAIFFEVVALATLCFGLWLLASYDDEEDRTPAARVESALAARAARGKPGA